ncbi:MAG: hypothetical protein QM737_15890 [Ferruginibacter sp.]
MQHSSKHQTCPLCGAVLNNNTLNITVIHAYNSNTGTCEDLQVDRNDWQLLAGNKIFVQRIITEMNLN